MHLPTLNPSFAPGEAVDFPPSSDLMVSGADEVRRHVGVKVLALLPMLAALSGPAQMSPESPLDLDPMTEDGSMDSSGPMEFEIRHIAAFPLALTGCAGTTPDDPLGGYDPTLSNAVERQAGIEDGSRPKGVGETANIMLQTMAILLVLTTGFGPRIWKGSGPIQSGVSIVSSGILFMVYWTSFGLVSLATPVAGVVAGWEPTAWLIKKLIARGGTPPSSP